MKKRLLNCDFVNASSFKVNISNKAKLLYLIMFTNADDRGFVDTCDEIIKSLDENDNEFRNEVNLSILANNFESALQELIEKGYLYEFKDNHGNKVYLIRHWFYHNKLIKGLWTNYGKFYKLVKVEDDEYHLKTEEEIKNPYKENNIILNEDNIDNVINKILDRDEPKVDEQNGDELTQDDLPFPVDPKRFKKGNKNETN